MNQFQKLIYESALGYIDRGWPVLPVSKASKRPLNENGSRGATTDRKQVEEWFKQFPSANIAVTTGPPSGFFIVDVDQSAGKDGIASLETHFGEQFDFDLKHHLYGKTPTGGLHLPFEWRDGVKNAQGVITHVDIRGEGGYIVVAPSSRNFNGKWCQYYWNNMNNAISPILPWVDELLEMKTGSQPSPHGEKFDVQGVMQGISEGERDDALFRYACHLRVLDIPFGLASGFLKEAAARCVPPFDSIIAEQKVVNAYTHYQSPKDRMQDMVEQLLKKKGKST